MSLNNLQLLLADIEQQKYAGGSAYKKVNAIMKREATTDNISELVTLLETLRSK